MHRVPRSIQLALGLVLVAALGAGALHWSPDVVSRLTYAAESGQAQAAKEQLETARDLSEAFKHVAKALRPSVVSINSTRRVEQPAARRPDRARPALPEGLPEEFRRFFDDDRFERFFQAPEGQTPRRFEQRGFGTGVIVSEDGYLLTNNHVIRGASEVRVTLANGRQYTAKVVGTDEKTDLAVLKIDANGLLPADLGDSDAMEVGEWVLAIGGPFGLSHSVTAGIVSAKGRANMGITDYEDFLQTDAAINPGNSGGPLVNLRGQVIGINTAIASRSGSYAGVGFAIPANMARQVMESIITTGRVDRGWLGAAIQDLNEDLARSFGYKSRDGVLVGDVVSGSPAEKAGLQSGDIVMKFDGQPMRNANQLRHAVAGTAPETQSSLVVFRDGNQETLRVTIGRLDTETAATGTAKPPREEEGVASEDLGLSVRTLTPEVAEQLGFDKSERGVVVTEVEPGSLAADVGVRADDVIVSVGRTRIQDAQGFRKALDEENLADGIRLQVKREGVSRFVFVRSS